MEETKLIYGQISKIMAEVKSISKARENTQQGFKFRGIDDVYNHIQPLFAKHGVFPVIQQKNEMKRDVGQTAKGGTMYRMRALYDINFYAQDGSFVTVTLEAEGMDSADKGTNKCHSVAHKYALLTLLMIPTEDMAEPDAQTPEPANFQPEPTPTPPQEPAITLETLKRLNTLGSKLYSAKWDEKRAEFVVHITKNRTDSSKDLTENEANRIIVKINQKIAELEADEKRQLEGAK